MLMLPEHIEMIQFQICLHWHSLKECDSLSVCTSVTTAWPGLRFKILGQ